MYVKLMNSSAWDIYGIFQTIINFMPLVLCFWSCSTSYYNYSNSNDSRFKTFSLFINIHRFPKAGKALLLSCLTASVTILAFLTANVYVSRKKVIVE